jgi:hypothetical protein
MRKFVFGLGLLVSISGLFAEPTTSALWKQYLEQKQSGGQTWLPDYSYAGYKRGEAGIRVSGKTFRVTDYGARPDDLSDDREGIQRAISAAEANGGGIVFFPKGRYLVNTTMENRGTIRIESDNIVLKGEGCTRGGTIIHSIQPYGGGDPHKMQRLHLGQNLFLIHSRYEETPLRQKIDLCRVTADAPRQSMAVSVDATDRLKVNDYVYLYALNKAIIEEMVKPYEVDEKWTTTTRNGAYTVEIHQIKSISGRRVEFYEPVRYDVKQKHNWVLKECRPIKEVGIEDICFMGNGYHRFRHHRSGMDDSGWSMIKMKGVADSWVRRCSFINCSQTIYVALSSSVSVLNIFLEGTQGHHIPRAVFFDYGFLGGLILDRAGYSHGPSLSWGSVATVFWRCISQGSIDCHAGRPYVSLFDNGSGGEMKSSGGLRDYPQHLRYLTIWNFEHTAEAPVEYDFWRKGKPNRFVKPIVVGFHGSPAVFSQDQLEVLESQGQRVKPDSLYEAQLQLRLGELPAWMDEAKRDYAELSQNKLPRYYDRNSDDQAAFLYREKFAVVDMLTYLTSLSLQMFNSVQFTYSVDDETLALDTDQGFVRNSLYALMNCIYRSCTRHGNTIQAKNVTRDGKKYVSFMVASGPFSKTLTRLDDDDYLQEARIYAKKLDGILKVVETKGKLVFEYLVPATLEN